MSQFDIVKSQKDIHIMENIYTIFLKYVDSRR